MSERVFFVFAVPSINLKSRHVEYRLKNVVVSTELQKCLNSVVRDTTEEENGVRYVRLTLIKDQPEYIEYNYSSRVPFEDIISPNFVDQQNALLRAGRLIKIERFPLKDGKRDKLFTLYNVDNDDTSSKNKDNDEIDCSRTNVLISTFVQQCQLVSRRHKLLPYVKAWQDCEPVDCTDFTEKGNDVVNIRLSCCFNNIVVMIDKRSTVCCKLGILRHDCSFVNDKNARFLVTDEAIKWYADSSFVNSSK